MKPKQLQPDLLAYRTVRQFTKIYTAWIQFILLDFTPQL